jgi:hypothetical protein
MKKFWGGAVQHDEEGREKEPCPCWITDMFLDATVGVSDGTGKLVMESIRDENPSNTSWEPHQEWAIDTPPDHA